MPFVIKSIDHIQLAAPQCSEKIARNFYGGIMGFAKIQKPEELRKRGGVWFVFKEFQIRIGIEKPFSPAKKAHPAFEVENIGAFKLHLLNNGVTCTEDEIA